MDLSYIRSRLRYEPNTGKLYWLSHPDMPGRWNTRWSGKEAFTSKTSHGYRHGSIGGKALSAHRVAWAMNHGAWPADQLDHVNHDKSDNRIENLRVVTNAENHQNSPIRRSNTSGAVGVSRYSARDKWQAQIRCNGTHEHLGHFDSFEEAVEARRAAEIRYGFHPNHGRTGAR